MTTKTVYFPGGYEPDAPNNNLAERWDLEAATFTRWNLAGEQVEQRPLTDVETAALQAMAVQQTASDSMNALGALITQTISDNDTYLALAAPTTDDLTAQVRRLTRQVTGLARWVGTVTPNPHQQDFLNDISDVTTP